MRGGAWACTRMVPTPEGLCPSKGQGVDRAARPAGQGARSGGRQAPQRVLRQTVHIDAGGRCMRQAPDQAAAGRQIRRRAGAAASPARCPSWPPAATAWAPWRAGRRPPRPLRLRCPLRPRRRRRRCCCWARAWCCSPGSPPCRPRRCACPAPQQPLPSVTPSQPIPATWECDCAFRPRTGCPAAPLAPFAGLILRCDGTEPRVATAVPTACS